MRIAANESMAAEGAISPPSTSSSQLASPTSLGELLLVFEQMGLHSKHFVTAAAAEECPLPSTEVTVDCFA